MSGGYAPKSKTVILTVVVIIAVVALGCCGISVFTSSDDEGSLAVRPVLDVPSIGRSPSTSAGVPESTPVQSSPVQSSSAQAASPGQPAATSRPAQPAPTKTTKKPPNCDPSYPDMCLRPTGPDLDCADVDRKNFRVREPDRHRFDNDNDGIGCES